MARTRTTSRWVKRIAVTSTAVAIIGGIASFAWARPDSHPSEQDAKAAAIASMQAANTYQRAHAPKSAKPDPAARTPAACDPIGWDEGVSDTQEAPIPKGVIRVNSVWASTFDNHHYAVYAGVSAADSTQGLMMVLTYSPCGVLIHAVAHPTPNRHGAVHIAAAHGHRLTLVDSSGAPQATFDVDTGHYDG